MNIKVGFENLNDVSCLQQTVNYQDLLGIASTHFNERKKLLEELVYGIEQDTVQRFPQIKYLLISIRKLNPPLGAEVESSEVSVEKHYPANNPAWSIISWKVMPLWLSS